MHSKKNLEKCIVRFSIEAVLIAHWTNRMDQTDRNQTNESKEAYQT